MDKYIIKGFALILFGILLCVGDSGINSTVSASFSDFPFSLAGVVTGAFGLAMIFSKEEQ